MIAAVYARKSTEQSGVPDAEKSVARQIEHADGYAAAKGWTVADAHVYVDDGISGAEFAARPGFLRLMNALKPRPPFGVLIMSEESRLGREAIETAYALKQIVAAGVRVFFYLEDRERTLDSPTDKIMLSLTSFADELEREKARQRTYDAMVRKARAGHVTGGRVFGYDNLRMDTGGVRRVINDAEATIVRRIFELAATGVGLTNIAKTLNAEHAPSPRAQQGRPNGWVATSVREVLHRPIYRGELLWNQSRKRDRWGVKRQRNRPEQEWIRLAMPELAIVSEAQWTAAQTQMTKHRERYAGSFRKLLVGREPKYLLSGFLRCAMCGSGLEARSRSHGRERRVFYGCSAFHRRGRSVCSNSLTVPMEIADAAVLSSIEANVLDPRVLDAAVRRAAKRLSDPCGSFGPSKLRRDLVAIDRELANLTAAVAAGGDVASLVTAMRDRETQRRLLLERLRASDAPTLSPPAVVADLQARLTDWRSLLSDETPKARTLLKRLIVGRLTMAPTAEGFYRFEGKGTLEPLLAGAIPTVPQSMASPTGFEPVFWP